MDTDTTLNVPKEDLYLLPTYRKLPITLVRGDGAYVWDVNGNRYLDFYGGHCVTLLGHCPPRVVRALKEQASRLLFYSNVVSSDVRGRAAHLLAQMAPRGLGNIFFCNSGSEAVETALKIARKATGRAGVIALEGDFHGRTLGSLATTWNPAYRAPYQSVLPPTHFVPMGDANAVDRVLRSDGDVAAVILEPIQSIAGMVEAPPSFYTTLRALCDRAGVCLIFDEVQTGIGRTGGFSVGAYYGVIPDMITLAKSLGSGVPVGATLVSDELSASVEYGDQGSTFGGGMLAMAAVEATLQTIMEDDLMARAHDIFQKVSEAAAPYVAAVRGRGCLIGLQLGRPCAPIAQALRRRGVLCGGSADPHVLRLMPPLITGDAEIALFAQALHEAAYNA